MTPVSAKIIRTCRINIVKFSDASPFTIILGLLAISIKMPLVYFTHTHFSYTLVISTNKNAINFYILLYLLAERMRRVGIHVFIF